MAVLTPPEPPRKARNRPVTRLDGQRASVAQLLLLARLRARNRRDLAVDSLERAAQVILVTCKNWLLPARDKRADQAAEPGPPQAGPPSSSKPPPRP